MVKRTFKTLEGASSVETWLAPCCLVMFLQEVINHVSKRKFVVQAYRSSLSLDCANISGLKEGARVVITNINGQGIEKLAKENGGRSLFDLSDRDSLG